ncbi:MAG: hypothetical protein VZQ47_01555 [Treponema sp.]|nr:hypothetical protein [Treponema sp.]MEE3434224.1 hypothetical protein [Treponema sp.]
MKVGLRKNTAVRFFAALLAAAGFAFSSCGNLGLDEKSFQNKVSSYFEEMTSNAAVGAYQLDPANAPTDKYGNFCFPYDQDCKVTLLLRNPQRYHFTAGSNMEFSMAGESGASPIWSDAISVLIEQDASDTSKIYVTYPSDFLRAHPLGDDISPVVRLYHPVSHASFGVYDRLKLSSNAPPPSPSGALVVQTNESTGSKWVVCFKLPGSSAINNYHSDITSVSVNGNAFEPTITTGTISYPSGAALSSSVPSGITLAKNQVTGLDFTPESGTTQAQDAYFMTGDVVDQNQRVYTITVTDSAGLSSSVAVSARGFKLSAPDAFLVGGTEAFDKNYSTTKNTVGQNEDGSAWITLRAEAKTAGGLTDGDGHAIDRYDYDPSNASIIYELHRATALDSSTLIRAGTLSGVSGNISVPAGTTYVKAFVRKPLYADSEPVVWNCRAVCTNFFVKESGSNADGEGSRAKPYRTIQKAVQQIQDGLDAGDYVPNTILNIRLLSDLTPPADFAWTESGNYFAQVYFGSGTLPAGLVLNIKGDGARRTISGGQDVSDTSNRLRGVMFVNAGTVNIEDINITGGYYASGSAQYGGGLYIGGGTVTYKNGSVYGNFSGAGAGVNVSMGTNHVFENVQIYENGRSKYSYGALCISSGAKLTCNNCVIRDNGYRVTTGSGAEGGGGVCNQGTLVMTGGSITGNEIYPTSGGGVYNKGGTLDFTNVEISGNSASCVSNSVKAAGGAIYNTTAGQVSLTNCVIKGNTAAIGPAIYSEYGVNPSVSLASCVITQNTALYANDNNNGAVYFKSDSPVTKLAEFKLSGKNIIYDNTAPDKNDASVSRQANVFRPYLAPNETNANIAYIQISGSVADSKIGVNIPYINAEDKPAAGAPKAFTAGYGYPATNARKPGLVFFAENGYGVTDKEGEAAFAVSGGAMYDPTDFKITTALDGAMAKPNVAKTFNVTISAYRKESGSFPATANLVYNLTDHKLYEVGGTVPATGEGSDNPAVTWTAALYNGGKKIASGASIAESGLTVTIPAAAMPQPDTYILKITATYMGYTHDASFPISVRNVYGDKSAPTAVGDIVFSDGTATPYSDSLVLDANQKTNAVAVIFYAGDNSNPSLTTRMLGVGLKEGSNLMWAPSGYPGYSVGSYDATPNSRDNGSVNWGGVCGADSDAEANAATNYPAHNYANAYGVEISGVSSGWYLPAHREIEALLGAKDTVNNAIGKIGSPAVSVGSGPYWSSTLWNGSGTPYINQATVVPYDSAYKDSLHNVRAIRRF